MITTPFSTILESIDSLDRPQLEQLKGKVEAALLSGSSSQLHDLWLALSEVMVSKGIPIERVERGYRKHVVAAQKQFSAVFKNMKPRPDRRQRIMVYRIGIEQALRNAQQANIEPTAKRMLENLAVPGGAAAILDDAFPGYALSLFQHLNDEARQ